MDYKKIYDDFIKDRRLKENRIKGYFERHHIIPRALGGDNSKPNLIKLTPEDHYFAHLLLAKIHGGGMWKALFLLSNKVFSVTSQRYMYGVAKRKNSASENFKYNHVVYHWYNLDNGNQENLTIYKMHKKYGMNRAHWTSVVTVSRNSLGGWTMYERRKKHNRGSKGKTFNFVNRDGRNFTGTQKDFCDKFNVNYASGTRICRHHSVTKCGWRLKGVADRIYNHGKNGLPGKKNKGNVFIFQKDGEQVRGTRIEMAKFFGTSPDIISSAICAAKKGNVIGYSGWEYIGVANETI